MHDTDRLEKSAEALTAERKDMVQKSNLTDDQLGWKYKKKTKGAATTTTESNNSKTLRKKWDLSDFIQWHELTLYWMI